MKIIVINLQLKWLGGHIRYIQYIFKANLLKNQLIKKTLKNNKKCGKNVKT